ncbi:prohibitin family protein [Haloferax mediterranei ATCC 33500]|uniref:Membrane protease subunit, stomatin/prohibitin n=1 Tax=Haloferax mediterranei (strain ATCC 33500 / DSM 1411 / JCM 8866 / NBRC 14739 / NCIMB 2177 / R-4) TaxID=523841 RepID=I3R0Y1_HALMT|nr:prohibitin family protein [Haloferax mediterranei]AFK17891.1 membrane protease subunit, stomatin/prohibitin [Haloferax mediterranei ATCC 33500]AHZ22685.1 membrane protease subunit, stomatin/prohibitin [Haloferax mediterranei ATCC 33500]EMA02834.1 membrane protease subunit, stomatin/prohibitin [Haloferax mediterranei ATCC 33500]MDX5987982.1 prohibitin family protein [Haloferax mediterranei ATCC 33500]QCQ74450.1 prohibitin family protein [Haloferax mediterranei ATCC 33500]
MSSNTPSPPSVTPRSLTRTALIGVIALLLIAAPIAGLLAWEPVEEGNVKVVKKWGATTDTVFQPGAHLINPVSQSTVSLSVRPQSYTMSGKSTEGAQQGDDAITVLTKDGLRTDIDVTVRYRVDSGKAVKFYRNYRTLGSAEERLIRPSIRSVLRTEAGRLPVTVIYTGEGQTKLKAAAEKELSQEFAEAGLILEAVQVRNVELPSEYAQAVEQKEITEQRRQQKKDELAVEELEAERKRIEAQGQADANRILAESLSDEVLTQKYIKKLDETDTVYIPVGEGGYPQFVRSLESDGSESSSSSSSSSSSASDLDSASSSSSSSNDAENTTAA